jgi:hypothetical protein
VDALRQKVDELSSQLSRIEFVFSDPVRDLPYAARCTEWRAPRGACGIPYTVLCCP